MLIVVQNRENLYLYPLEELGGLSLDGSSLSFNGPAEARVVEQRTSTPEEAKERFEDIVEALKSKKVDVYDVREDVGYWNKPQKAHTPKKAPTPKESPKE